MFNACKQGGCCIVSTPNSVMLQLEHTMVKDWALPKAVFQYLSPIMLQAMIRSIGGKIVYVNRKFGLGHNLIKFEKV